MQDTASVPPRRQGCPTVPGFAKSSADRSAADGGGLEGLCPACPAEVPIVGRSQAMVDTFDTLRLIAESRCNPVLIVGETGTGKELAARAVHAWRHGSDARLVAVNCAALTASLLESELFGHVKGSFTGADRDKTGLFELAGEGTIFLDEVSEMPLDLQAKLLRVLQERTFRKVGGTKDLHCRATIIASSNRDLLEAIKEGQFRQDLYYRLAVFPVRLPPLRDPSRRNDIRLLAEHFLRTTTIADRDGLDGLTDEAAEILSKHEWPGNVRELRNVIDRAVLLERGGKITSRSIRLAKDASPSSAGAHPEPRTPLEAIRRKEPTKPEDFSLETAEREFIIRALQETGWQRTRAAALLGITRATLHSKLKRYDIQPPDRGGNSTGAARRETNRHEACA